VDDRNQKEEKEQAKKQVHADNHRELPSSRHGLALEPELFTASSLSNSFHSFGLRAYPKNRPDDQSVLIR
jgi:hypothetical protein